MSSKIVLRKKEHEASGQKRIFSWKLNADLKSCILSLSQLQGSSLMLIKSLYWLFHKNLSSCLNLYGLNLLKILTFPDGIEASVCQALHKSCNTIWNTLLYKFLNNGSSKSSVKILTSMHLCKAEIQISCMFCANGGMIFSDS